MQKDKKISIDSAKSILKENKIPINQLGLFVSEYNKNKGLRNIKSSEEVTLNAILALLCPAGIIEFTIMDKMGNVKNYSISIIVPEQESTPKYFFTGIDEDNNFSVQEAAKSEILQLLGIHLDGGTSVWHSQVQKAMALDELIYAAATADLLLRKEFVGILNHEKIDDAVTAEKISMSLEDSIKNGDIRWLVPKIVQHLTKTELNILKNKIQEKNLVKKFLKEELLLDKDEKYFPSDIIKALKNSTKNNLVSIGIQGFYLEDNGQIAANRGLFIRDYRYLYYIDISNNEKSQVILASLDLNTSLDILNNLLDPESNGLQKGKGLPDNLSINSGNSYCPECGLIYGEGKKYCSKCGCKLKEQVSSNLNKDSVSFCKYCGNKLKDNNKFCSKCGASVK